MLSQYLPVLGAVLASSQMVAAQTFTACNPTQKGM